MSFILFNAEMVKAVLDGTQTNFSKEADFLDIDERILITDLLARGQYDEAKTDWGTELHHEIGDTLYVQEEFSISSGFDGMDIELAKMAYAGDFFMSAKYRNDGRENETWNGEWREAKTMPEEFSRITLKIIDIIVEHDDGEDFYVYEFEMDEK